MKITNHAGLPAPLVRAIESFVHDRGGADMSVTELLLPPRLGALLHKYEDELEEEASERMWALLGTLLALMLERAAHPAKSLAETRLYTEILGWKISGKPDHFSLEEDGILDDWKLTSVWTVKHGGRAEWEAQLNIYAHLIRQHFANLVGGPPREIRGLRVTAILRDWSIRQAEREKDYPQAQTVALPVPMWPDAQVEQYLAERVQAHQLARDMLAAGVLPYCEPEDKWQKPDVWAVMKAGRKSAVKLYDTFEAAAAHLVTANIQNGSVDKRPGVAIRCQSYCPVAKQCAAFGDGGYGPVPQTELED